MTLPNLISFSGYPLAGKDAAADVMVTRARFVKTYMDKPLVEALLDLNPWLVDKGEGTVERFSDLYANLGEDAIKNFDEARRLLRVLETKVGRRNGMNIWTDQVFDEVRHLLSLNKKVVISGVQYHEDLAVVRELDGVCVWITRPRSKAKSSTIAISAQDCDLVVTNEGNIKEFYVSLTIALEEYANNVKEN